MTDTYMNGPSRLGAIEEFIPVIQRVSILGLGCNP